MNLHAERVFVEVSPSTPSPADSDGFTVGDWLIEPSLCRVTRSGMVLRIRPQLMDVLVCLASRPGRCVSRTEILSTVWAGRFVAESGLARCIAELRQVLGDDARQPRIIETITKRGYRLMVVDSMVARARREEAVPAASPMVPPVRPAVLYAMPGVPAKPGERAASRGVGEWLRSAVRSCRRWRPWLAGGGTSS
jgi:DNA-binding winged helix-turn-helix (wHTH) protein